MTLLSLAFLLGVVAVQQLSDLPGPHHLLFLGFLAALLAYKRYGHLLFFILGLLWASLYAGWLLSDRLPDRYQNSVVTIEGYVSNLPQQQDGRVSFDFAVRWPADNFPEKIRLSWYYPQQRISAGQYWRMSVKLKQPYGRLNPGGFDFQASLFANHIGASGYVRNKPAPELLASSVGIAQYFSSWRQAIVRRLDATLADGEQLEVIKALTIGTQDAISQAQWDVFRATGTTHLIVISGSHISLIAGLVYVLVRRGWAWLNILSISPQQVAALIAWLSGLFYAGLAGYSIPTLRAVIMLTVAMAAIVWQRNTAPFQVLMLALLAVLLFDPLAVLSVGFWLSFIAVALLIYVSAGRLGRNGYWREAALSQLATFAGLSPLLMLFFQQISLISPIANWLAVPIIGLFAVPLALLAVLLLFLFPPLASLLLRLTDLILQGLWWLLTKLADLSFATLDCLQPPWYAMLLAGIGVLLLLAPRGIPGRYLSLFLFLPLVFASNVKPQPGSLWLTLLDIGQGLSVVLQTTEHSLVFDTGNKYSEDSDMGDSVILPFLRHQGIQQIDTLIISHGDKDHSGGANSLLAGIQVENVFSSAAEWAEGDGKHYCKAGQTWQWDHVQFTFLSPPEAAFIKENDNSCVLYISTGQHSFLLTGDIEKTAEDWLVGEYGKDLNSSVLVAAHHGSKTSSNIDFLHTVNPKLILIPAGHLNRFGFPHKQVLDRYRQLDIPWLNTAERGAITIHSDQADLKVESERDRRKRYWMSSDTLAGNE